MGEITIYKKDLEVLGVDARFMAMLLKKSSDDIIVVSKDYRTQELFTKKTVPSLKPATIDLIAVTFKDDIVHAQEQKAIITKRVNELLANGDLPVAHGT